MFSGIVEALGTVVELRPEPPGCRLIVREPKIAAETQVADSISVNGCCLTVIERQGDTFGFQAGPETLARTNLGDLKPGSPRESRTGAGRRRSAGRAFRQRTHRRRGHAACSATTAATGPPSGSPCPASWPCRWPRKARSPSTA